MFEKGHAELTTADCSNSYNKNKIENNLLTCTWTHTISWYIEYGMYLGTTSATVTYDTGTSFDCTGTRLEAERQANSMPIVAP